MAIGTAAAVIGGSVISGALGSNAAGKAADAQRDAAAQQTALEEYIYEDTKGRFEPYYEGGLDYNNALRYELLGGDVPVFGGSPAEITTRTSSIGGSSLGSNPGGLTDFQLINNFKSGGGSTTEYLVNGNVFGSLEEAQAFAAANPVGGQEYQGFQATPGYQFALEQGQAAIDGSAAARGNVFSGATLQAQQEYGTGLAQQEYGNYLNRLTGQAAQGQAAAGNIATAGSNYASGAGNALAASGNAQAAGYIGQANALTGAINNGLGAFGYMNSPSSSVMTASNGVSIPTNTFNSVQALF